MLPIQILFSLVVLAGLAGSLTVWVKIAQRMSRGEPILPQRPYAVGNWFPETLLVVLFVWLTTQLLIRGLAMLLKGDGEEISSLQVAQLTCLVNGTFLVLIPMILMGIDQQRPSQFGMDLSEWTNDLRLGLITFVASLLPVYMVLILTSPWRTLEDQHPFLRVLQMDTSAITITWIAVSTIIFAPLAEELLYRVVLLGWLEKRIPSGPAIGVSSVVFAGAHGLADSLALLPLAMILGYVYHRRRSYLAVVVLHAVFNALNLIMALAQPFVAGE